MSGTVELSVAIVLEKMGDGRVRAAPLFERGWMAHDDLEDALDSLRSFLEQRLAEATPTALARIVGCASEDEHAVRVVEVRVPLSEHDEEPLWFDVATVVLGPGAADLARARSAGRAAHAEPSAAASIAVTATPCPPWWGSRDVWIAVPVLDHVMRVPDEVDSVEGLDRAIRAEIERVLAASARDSLDVIAALPPGPTTVTRLEVSVRRPERLDAETRARGERASAESLRREQKHKHLSQIGRRVVGSPRPVRRDELLSQLETLLSSSERVPVLVRGPELAGKTSIIEHVLGKPGRLAFAVPVARFLAGEGSFGEWQTRVEETFRAAELLDAVLYIEDLGGLSLEREGSPVDLAGAMTPFLESRRVRFVGEVRDAEIDRFEARHRSLSSALVPLRVPAMSAAETVVVLEELMGPRPLPRGPALPERSLAPDAAPALVSLVERYFPYRALPGEAIRMASALRAALDLPRDADGSVPPIPRAELVRAFAERVGLPPSLLREDIALPPAEIVAALSRRVIGQEEAVLAVASTLAVVKAGLAAPGKPIATFLFAGPTGTGKTELARAIAAYLFGSVDALARFDMSEFMDPWSGDRLIRGFDREDGLLTRRARERPFSVLLLDEIEKAHPSVFDLLLQLLGEGRLTDARGKTAFFQNTLVVMTSNLGARDDRAVLGFAPEARGRAEVYVRAVRNHFRPELLNRIDRVVPFRPLAEGEALEIARLFSNAVAHRPGLTDPRHTLAVDPAALAEVARAAWTSDGGARALRREVEDTIVVGAARALAREGRESERGVMSVTPATDGASRGGARVAHRGLVFELRGTRGKVRGHARTPLDRITFLRRRLSRFCSLSNVEWLRTDRARLVSDLARASQRRATAHEVSVLEQRLAWITPRLEAVDARRRELEACEDLALAAFVNEERVEPLVVEAERVARALESALFEIVAHGDSDDLDVVITSSFSKRLALDLFVGPLVRPIPGVQLHAEWHFPQGIGPPDPSWPTTRAWGPARTSDQVPAILASPRFHDVYASFTGRDAYFALGPLEGLVRIVVDGTRLGVIVMPGPMSPHADASKLPVLATVPSTPVVELDFDRGLARVFGDDEDYPFEGKDWAVCLPRLALVARAREEGL